MRPGRIRPRPRAARHSASSDPGSTGSGPGTTGRGAEVAAHPPDLLVRDGSLPELLRGPLGVDRVGALGRAPTALGGRDALGHPAGGEQEAGVTDHPVVRADRQALEVPGADHRLERLRLGEPAVVAQVLGEPGQLGRRRHVRDEHAARGEGAGDGLDVLPRGEHVQHDPVDRRRRQCDQHVGEVPEGQRPRRVRAAEEPLDVRAGDRREVLAALDRVQGAGVTDGTQQVEGQRAGADAGLDHARARVDVGHRDDLAGVLGVDHRRARAAWTACSPRAAAAAPGSPSHRRTARRCPPRRRSARRAGRTRGACGRSRRRPG